MARIKNFKEFIEEFDKNSDDDKDKLKKFISKNNLDDAKITHPLQHDVFVYRAVVIILGIIIVIVLIVSLQLVCGCGKSEIPSGIIAIGATSVGALSGLISKSKSS
jgi:hypothetical protein